MGLHLHQDGRDGSRASAIVVARRHGVAHLAELAADLDGARRRVFPQHSDRSGSTAVPAETTPPWSVLLGDDSDVGAAVAAGDRDLALIRLRGWMRVHPRAVVMMVEPGPPTDGRGAVVAAERAARMLELAVDAGVPALVLTAVGGRAAPSAEPFGAPSSALARTTGSGAPVLDGWSSDGGAFTQSVVDRAGALLSRTATIRTLSGPIVDLAHHIGRRPTVTAGELAEWADAFRRTHAWPLVIDQGRTTVDDALARLGTAAHEVDALSRLERSRAVPSAAADEPHATLRVGGHRFAEMFTALGQTLSHSARFGSGLLLGPGVVDAAAFASRAAPADRADGADGSAGADLDEDDHAGAALARALGLVFVAVRTSRRLTASAHTVSEIRRVYGARAASEGGFGEIGDGRSVAEEDTTAHPFISANGELRLAAVPDDDPDTTEAMRSSKLHAVLSMTTPERWPLPSRVLYESAWLLTRYPVATIAGLLASEPSATARAEIVHESRRRRIPVLPIDVTTSWGLPVVEVLADQLSAVRLPLTDVPGVDASAVDRLVESRPYSSVADFVDRSGIGVPAMRALAEAGALDSLVDASTSREQIVLHIRSLERARRAATVPEAPQSLFDLDDLEAFPTPAPAPPPASAPAPESTAALLDDPDASAVGERAQTRALHEAGSSGGAGSGGRAPSASMRRFQPMLDELGVRSCSDLADLGHGSDVVVAGERVSVRALASGARTTASDILLDDGTATVVCSSPAEVRGRASRPTGRMLVVQGRVERIDDEDALPGDADEPQTVLVIDVVYDLRALWEQWVRDHRLAG